MPESLSPGPQLPWQTAEWSSDTTLASWHFNAADWSRFRRTEVRNRNRNIAWTVLGIFVLCMIVFGGAWTAGLGVGLLLGVTYTASRLYFHRSKIKLPAINGIPVAIRIAPEGLSINEHWVAFQDQTRLHRVDLIERRDGFILEFHIRWTNSKGLPVRDEVRTPIPADCIEEARNVIEQLQIP